MADLSIRQIQKASKIWRRKNFPRNTADEQILGMIEELGELAHAYLKAKQNIRQDEQEPFIAMHDAMGDLIIYMCGFADWIDADVQSCVNWAWDQVKDRNWIDYPKDGTNA